MTHPDSFGARSKLSVGGREVEIFRIDALQTRYDGSDGRSLRYLEWTR